MSITLQFVFEVDDVATDVTSAVLSDATGAYGVKRNDTDAVVVADGTAMTKVATGTYEHSFDPPADGLEYTWVVEYVYDTVTYRESYTYTDTTQVVTVTQAKEILHVSGTDHDDRIDDLIDAATSFAEKYQQRKYLTQTCVDYLDDWPDDDVIRPKWSPLLAVSSITYVDIAGATQTWSSDEYDVDTDSEPGQITLAYGESWPSVRGDHNGIAVTYTAGYGSDADNVPHEIRTAILLLVYDWFYHPDREGQSLPASVKVLLGMERMIGL